MSNKKVTVIQIESGAEEVVEAPIDSLKEFRMAVESKLSISTYFLVDENGVPIISDELLFQCATSKIYLVVKELGIDMKVIKPENVTTFQKKVAPKFLEYARKDAEALFATLNTKVESCKKKCTDSEPYREKHIAEIKAKPLYKELYEGDNIDEIKKQYEQSLKDLNREKLEIEGIISNFKKNIVDYVTIKIEKPDKDPKSTAEAFIGILEMYTSLQDKLDTYSKIVNRFEKGPAKAICCPTQFLANQKQIVLELKKNHVFNEILSKILMKLKLICEKENIRRDYTYSKYATSLPNQINKVMQILPPNIISLQSKEEKLYFEQINPEEFKAIACSEFPFFLQLANIEKYEEQEEYKSQLVIAHKQIKEMKAQIDELNKQLSVKPLQVEKPSDSKDNAQLKINLNKQQENCTALKELITSFATKCIGKTYEQESFIEALQDVHTKIGKMSEQLKTSISDILEIKKHIGSEKVCRIKYGGKLSEGDCVIFEKGLHGSLVGIVDSNIMYICNQQVEGTIILGQILKLNALSDKIVNVNLCSIKQFR